MASPVIPDVIGDCHICLYSLLVRLVHQQCPTVCQSVSGRPPGSDHRCFPQPVEACPALTSEFPIQMEK